MSTSTHPTTFADLYTTLLNNLRQDSSVTATVAEAKRMINTALHDMVMGYGEHLVWAHRRTTLITQQDYSTGTVSISQGSTTLTGTSTVWTTTNALGSANVLAGNRMVLAGQNEVYEVSSVGGAGSITLTNAYVGDTLSAQTYLSFQDAYSLASDFYLPLDVKFFDANRTVELVGERDFRARFIRNNVPGRPQYATIIDAPFSAASTARQRKVVFHPPPDDFYQIPYAYVTSNVAISTAGAGATNLSSDTDEPICPLPFRMAIVHKAAAQWYAARSDDMTRAQWEEQQYRDIVARMVGHTEIGQQLPRFTPMVAPYRGRAAAPYRGRGGGRYTLGTSFDQMRS